MDFGNYEGLRKPHAYVSADMILYHQAQFTGDLLDDIEILISTRKIEPFQNYLSLTFGGYVDPTDNSPLHTALRETQEESGIDLSRMTLPYHITFLGSFGPARIHHRIKFYKQTNGVTLEAPTETKKFGNPRPCITFVFAHECKTKLEGNESDEAKNIQWMSVREIISKYGNTLAFDHAAFLNKLLLRLRSPDINLLEQAMKYINYDKP